MDTHFDKYLEFDSFLPVYKSSTDKTETTRRFMQLVLAQDLSEVGGTGFVIKAKNALGEVFALKGIKKTPEVNYKAAKQAFEQEFYNQKELSFIKGFPDVYGMGYAEGDPYILMEWIEGITLDKARAQLPVNKGGRGVDAKVLSEIALSVLATLKGITTLRRPIIHRDISPRNIMISTEDLSLTDQVVSGKFETFLIDFGSSAKALPVNEGFTVASNILRGVTQEYAPPEMLSADIEGILDKRYSQKIDLYSLCSVLYELYAGHTPYRLAYRHDESAYLVKTNNPPIPLTPVEERDELFCKIIMGGLISNQEERLSIAAFYDLLMQWQMNHFNVTPLSYSEWAIPKTITSELLNRNNTEILNPGVKERREARIARWEAEQAEEQKRLKRHRRRKFIAAGMLVFIISAVISIGLFKSVLDENAQELLELQEAQMAQEKANQERAEAAFKMAQEAQAQEGRSLRLAQEIKTGLWGYLDENGDWLIEPKYSEAPGKFQDGLAPMRIGLSSSTKEGLFGFIDESGELVIDAQFSEVLGFSEGLCGAQDPQTHLWGFINKDGNWVIPAEFSEVHEFSCGMAPVATNEEMPLWGFIDYQGAWIFDKRFIQLGSMSEDGLAPAVDNSFMWGFINPDGSWAIEAQYFGAKNFSEGKAPVIIDETSKLWAYIDVNGSLVIDPAFSEVKDFKSGKAPAKDPNTNLWGLIDELGAWTIEPSYPWMGPIANKQMSALDPETSTYGYLNFDNEWVIKPGYAKIMY
ncbi:MAG: WG repeat-containing protein [Coriobacteriia bacterium]|nr:WG repeat-containing protein [Coriobacteriia bacterium]